MKNNLSEFQKYYDNKKETNDIQKKNKIKKKLKFVRTCNLILKLLLAIFFLFTIFCYIIIHYFPNEYDNKNITFIKNIEVISYNEQTIDIAVEPTSEQEYCSIGTNSIDQNSFIYYKLENGKCYISIPYEEQYIYFKNSNGIITDSYLINDLVIDLNIKDNYYLSIGMEQVLFENMIKLGNPNITLIADSNILKIEGNKIIGNQEGVTTVKVMVNNISIKEFNVYVTNTITLKPTTFNYNKSYLTCGAYSSKEAELLDTILEDRIKDAGYGTRAGVVEAARFLTLEFPYRISYYWENGRVHSSGTHYVDGEGRYYHKGLYLSIDKYQTIKGSLLGPKMWGCKMTNLEPDEPYFIRGVKYPNGLDCSGFVTWALLNGGFDVGDIGAYQLPSIGELKVLSKQLINSDTIKVGDLLNFKGHIALIVGIDNNNFYVAESLNDIGGLVVKTYSKTKVNNTFKYVVLMDKVYKDDGNITNMWY